MNQEELDKAQQVRIALKACAGEDLKPGIALGILPKDAGELPITLHGLVNPSRAIVPLKHFSAVRRWSEWLDSNQRPLPPEGSALPG